MSEQMDRPEDQVEEQVELPVEEQSTPAPDLPDVQREALRVKMGRRAIGVSGRIAGAFLDSKLTPLLVWRPCCWASSPWP